MAITRWSPDTCDCLIEMDENLRLVDIIVKCAEHQHLDGQALLDEVIRHNRSFNMRGASIDEKRAEKYRIREKGPHKVIKPEKLPKGYPFD